MARPVLVGIILVAALVVVRYVAVRHVRARHGRFVWLMFIPQLVTSVAIIWFSLGLIERAPLVGVLIATYGAAYLAVLIRFLTRLTRVVTEVEPNGDLIDALSGPLTDYTLTLMGMLLIGALVFLVGLIAWAVTHAA